MQNENNCTPTSADGTKPKRCIDCSAINLCIKPKDEKAVEWLKFRVDGRWKTC